MCSRGERKQDACARVSQDETRPASRCRCPAATRSLASTRRGRKTGQAVPHCTETTQRLLVPSSVMTRLNRDPRVAEESDENASGCVSDTALFFLEQSGWSNSKTSLKSRLKTSCFMFPCTGLLGWWVKLQHRHSFFQNRPLTFSFLHRPI